LKQKDVFKLLLLSELNTEVREWLLTNFDTLIPEEIVIALRKYGQDEEL
jgi:hypothetical protein